MKEGMMTITVCYKKEGTSKVGRQNIKHFSIKNTEQMVVLTT